MEYIHKKNYIHRDLKPENFMIGLREYKDILYLIDFGLSKRYKDSKTGEHIKFINIRKLNGTAKFASVNSLQGYENSRRDDLEGLCYVLVYFLKGYLPWNKIKNKNKLERYKLILDMKKRLTPENLVGDKNNIEFIEFIKYCKKLDFEETPDYNYLRGLMINCISKNTKSIDELFNIDINNNNLLFSPNEKNNKTQKKVVNVSLTYSNQKTRSNTTKKFREYKIFSKNKKPNFDDSKYDDKLINESVSSSLGYIETKLKNYTNNRIHGIHELSNLFKNKNIKKNKITNLTTVKIGKVPITIDKNANIKTLKRTRFNFIKKSFGINDNNIEEDEEREKKIFDYDIQNIENANLKNEGCIIF